MTEKKLPTKEELRAEMQKTCDSVNRWRGIAAEILEHDGSARIQFRHYNGNSICTQSEPYRKPIVAPKKWTPVFVFWPPSVQSDFELYRAFSCGCFDKLGRLLVYYGDKVCHSEDWCEIDNRDNHSENWDEEWEKMEND